MVENNEYSRAVRRYFIECEEKYWQQQSAPPEEIAQEGLLWTG